MRIINFLLLLAFSASTTYAIDDKGAKARVYKGDCSDKNKGGVTYYKTKTLVDANRDGFYDRAIYVYCNGTKEVKKHKSSILALNEGNANVTTVNEDVDSHRFCYEVSDAVTGEVIGVLYSAAEMLNELNDPYDCEIDFNGLFMNHYLEQYDGVTVNETIVFQDPATGVTIKHITMPVSGKFVGFEYTSTEGNTYRIFTMRYVAE